jgi:hypothetical protein
MRVVLTALALVVLAGCTATGTASPPAGSAGLAGVGSPGNPLLVSCGQESFSDPPPPAQAQPGDLAIGPLYVVNGRRLAAVSPADYSSHGSWKVPFVVAPGATATVEIGPNGRGQVVISGPYTPGGGVVAATYRSCAGKTGFFAQSFTFLHGQTRGCVPLEVTTGAGRPVLHATVSLAAGTCAR